MSPAARVPMWARSTISDIQSAPQTFSSWDRCMSKAYCKWPAIIGIIIGCIIILSALACLINCLCCGISCCKACCSCCECCCPSGSGSGHGHGHGRGSAGQSKYLDDRAAYQPQARPAHGGYQAPQPPPTYRGASTAQFDHPNHSAPKMNEDALPAMPSWDQAVTRKVEDTNAHEDDMEMTPLGPSAPSHGLPPPAAAHRNDPGYAELPTNPPGRHAPHDRYGYDDGFGHNHSSAHPPGREPPHMGGAFSSPMSSYDQPYGQQQYSDYSHNSGPHQTTGPNMYMSQPPPPQQQQQQYHSIPAASSAHAEMPHHSAFQSQPQPPHGASPPPTYVSEYREPAYPTSQPGYQAYTPSHTTSSPPPPPFSAAQHDMDQPSRPPSLLMSGRKPLPNTWRGGV